MGFIWHFEAYENTLFWCLSWTSFPICFLVLPKSVWHHHHTNTHSWSFKLGESNQFKVDIIYKIGLSWIEGTWLTNPQKTACAITLSPFQISNQIAKFNNWKLIVARWILHQHIINAIWPYFEYLIWQFNSTSEWDLILKLATLWVK